MLVNFLSHDSVVCWRGDTSWCGPDRSMERRKDTPTLNGRQYRGNVVDRGPLVLQDVQADLAVRVDVRMEHLRGKSNLEGEFKLD